MGERGGGCRIALPAKMNPGVLEVALLSRFSRAFCGRRWPFSVVGRRQRRVGGGGGGGFSLSVFTSFFFFFFLLSLIFFVDSIPGLSV